MHVIMILITIQVVIWLWVNMNWMMLVQAEERVNIKCCQVCGTRQLSFRYSIAIHLQISVYVQCSNTKWGIFAFRLLWLTSNREIKTRKYLTVKINYMHEENIVSENEVDIFVKFKSETCTIALKIIYRSFVNFLLNLQKKCWVWLKKNSEHNLWKMIKKRRGSNIPRMMIRYETEDHCQ